MVLEAQDAEAPVELYPEEETHGDPDGGDLGAASLVLWWMDVAENDLRASAPKIAEYGGAGGGSADLRTMGYALAELAGLHDAPEPVKLELACWFYALGKISRLISDYKQGKPGKPDTWFDLSVYAMMARRIQATGNWP